LIWWLHIGKRYSTDKTQRIPEHSEADELFFNQKPVNMLIAIHGSSSYGLELSKKVDTPYAHTTEILGRLEDLGLIEGEDQGRKKIYTVTEKGREKAEALKKAVKAGGENQQ